MVQSAHNENVKTFIGLSSDIKPVDNEAFGKIGQGSTFFEADTQDTYYYYVEASGNGVWKKFNSSKVTMVLDFRN